LPARDFQEIRLAEALERGLCPLCDARQDAVYAALRGLAREGATDRGLRAKMDDGLGFCQIHSAGLARMELLQTSSQLATAVLLDAVLRRRLAALKKAARGDASGQARWIAEHSDQRCPVCAGAEEAARTTARRLLELSADPAWNGSLGTAEICLADLLVVWSAAAGSAKEVQARWSAIFAAQLDRLDGLERQLAEYAHNSTADRRHLITPEQQAAAAASIRLFGGSPERDRNR
jgi:hypothetical protein